MAEFWLMIFGIGAAVFFVGRAIARRMFKPKTALIVLGLACAAAIPFSGEIGLAWGVAVACCVIDLLVSTKPV